MTREQSFTKVKKTFLSLFVCFSGEAFFFGGGELSLLSTDMKLGREEII